MRYLSVITVLACLGVSANIGTPETSISVNRKLVRVYPVEYTGAFPNPLKGFRSSGLEPEDYPSLTRLYIKWNEIENSAGDGPEKIIDYCNRRWKDLPSGNIKVIPRVYLEWPYGDQNDAKTRDTVTSGWGEKRYCERFWPADLTGGDYSSEVFKKRLIALIRKMGMAWDNDPRVAYIEMGLIGWWGEQHSPSITPEMQKLIGDAFVSSFKNKLVMARYAKDFTSYPFGEYWDSFAHPDESDEAVLLKAEGDKWKYSVRGGELAYDWGDRSLTGISPDESLKNENNRNYIIDNIRRLHWNHLGWINEYDNKDPDVGKGAAEIQKTLGYRFVIDEVSYSPDILAGGDLEISFTVRNTGSSPFYYNWPVEASLLDPGTRQPVWKQSFSHADIRSWLPGDEWDTGLRKYKIEPVKNVVSGIFTIPSGLRKGIYILALSINDPGGNVPAVRFAIKNYFRGGRHPVGLVGVNRKIKNADPDDILFDDLYKDRTLYYEFR